MYYFIVNKHSRTGKGAEIWKLLKKRLEEKQVPYKAYVSEYAGHAFLLADQVCSEAEMDDCLIVVGGDGTVNEVLNGMKNFEKIRFGLIPTGSGNDFGRGLGVEKEPLRQLERLLGSKHEDAMDIGKVTYGEKNESRRFAISSGIGMDAIVAKKALESKLKKVLNAVHLGKITYLIITVETLFSMTTATGTVCYDQGEEESFKKMIFAAAMNFRAEGGGVPMAPSASAMDGKLSVCLTNGIPKWLTFFCLPFLVAAKHEWIKGFQIRDCKTCELHLDVPMVLHADGEYCGDVRDVKFECLEGMLRVMR